MQSKKVIVISVSLKLFLMLFSITSFANTMQDEIEYLLNQVKQTQCKINRNGRIYKGVKAVKHIKRKYKHFKNEIDSSEKFIEMSATKSTLSGKYYSIRCAGKVEKRLAEWLKIKLVNYKKIR